MADKTKQTITHKEYVRLKTLGMLGLMDLGMDPRQKADRYTFVNDEDEVRKERLEEYGIWYLGDSDRLKNFFTRANAIDYNTDPLYNENKKSYFWSVSSTETDIKRSHSGHPRNIVDTLVYVMGIPQIGHADETISKTLDRILRANRFKSLLNQKSRPLTLVEGWGAWKINWDSRFSDWPILLYYRADKVDFVRQNGSLRAIIYKDFYSDGEGGDYVLYETRWLGPSKADPSDPEPPMSLMIDKELYKLDGRTDAMSPAELTDLPQLRDVVPHIEITGYRGFLGCPNVFYSDPSEESYGRSIFTGKTDLFDDLDQCFSQSANSVRRSTVHEYFNTLYLETDSETGLPLMPNAFDRKYIQYRGMGGADGSSAGASPVQVVQPSVQFQQYSAEEQNLLVHAVSGILSPATLGIDVAKRDNAASEREKEKVTIFTRNNLLDEEHDILETLANDLLVANELMHTPKGKAITCTHYDVFVKYDEFANESLESRLETVLTAWQSGFMSDEMAIDTLYGDNLSKERKQRELDFIKEQRQATQGTPGSGMDPEALGEIGAAMGGDNEYDRARERADVDSLKEDMGIPNLEDDQRAAR